MKCLNPDFDIIVHLTVSVQKHLQDHTLCIKQAVEVKNDVTQKIATLENTISMVRHISAIHKLYGQFPAICSDE